MPTLNWVLWRDWSEIECRLSCVVIVSSKSVRQRCFCVFVRLSVLLAASGVYNAAYSRRVSLRQCSRAHVCASCHRHYRVCYRMSDWLLVGCVCSLRILYAAWQEYACPSGDCVCGCVWFHFSLFVCLKLNTVDTHTHTHTRTPLFV